MYWQIFLFFLQDTAGEEKYTGLSSFYCRNAGAAIFAFDLNCLKSFDSLGWGNIVSLIHWNK